jgi:O-antigen/teichoic acid export membrane protein
MGTGEENGVSGSGGPQPSVKGYHLPSLLRSSLLYLVGDLGTKVLTIFLIPIFTRVLTPEDYGIIGYAAALINVLSPLVGLGLIGNLPVLYYAYEGDERNRLISSVFNLTFLYALILTGLFFFFGPPIFARIAPEIPFNPYIILSLGTLFLMTFYYLPTGLFNIQERASAYMSYGLCLSLLGAGANIILVLVLRLGAAGALAANLLVGAGGLLTVLLILRKIYRPVVDGAKVRAMLHLSLPTLPHLFCSTLGRFADRFFLAGVSGLAATGFYSLAMNISILILLVMGGVTNALNPMFYRRANQQDATLPGDWSRLSTLAIFGAAWISLGVAMMGSEMVQLLAPPKYYEAIPLLPILALGQAVTLLYWLMAPGISYTRNTWVYPVASFPAMGVNLLLNAVLVPRFGAMGAAWAMVASNTAQALIFCYFSRRFFPVAYEYRQIGKVILLSAILFAISHLPFFAVFWVGMIFKPILLTLLPLGLLAGGFFSTQEIQTGKRFLRKLVGLSPIETQN